VGWDADEREALGVDRFAGGGAAGLGAEQKECGVDVAGLGGSDDRFMDFSVLGAGDQFERPIIEADGALGVDGPLPDVDFEAGELEFSDGGAEFRRGNRVAGPGRRGGLWWRSS
jgi:hypothetical protein